MFHKYDFARMSSLQKTLKTNCPSYFECLHINKPEPGTEREEDIQKMVGLYRNICKIDITSSDVTKAIRSGKQHRHMKRPLLIVIDEETRIERYP